MGCELNHNKIVQLLASCLAAQIPFAQTHVDVIYCDGTEHVSSGRGFMDDMVLVHNDDA